MYKEKEPYEEKHGCETMTNRVKLKDPFDYTDHLISYHPTFDEYEIIVHHGGTSIEISFILDVTQISLSPKGIYGSIHLKNWVTPHLIEQDTSQEFKSDQWHNP